MLKTRVSGMLCAESISSALCGQDAASCLVSRALANQMVSPYGQRVADQLEKARQRRQLLWRRRLAQMRTSVLRNSSRTQWDIAKICLTR